MKDVTTHYSSDKLYSHKRWFIAWLKKQIGVVSPATIPDGYKYEYDFMRRNLKKYKNIKK